MNEYCRQYHDSYMAGSVSSSAITDKQMVPVSTPSALSASVTMSALLLIKEVVVFVKGGQGEWIRGMSVFGWSVLCLRECDY
jgi:hypothetical protein